MLSDSLIQMKAFSSNEKFIGDSGCVLRFNAIMHAGIIIHMRTGKGGMTGWGGGHLPPSNKNTSSWGGLWDNICCFNTVHSFNGFQIVFLNKQIFITRIMHFYVAGTITLWNPIKPRRLVCSCSKPWTTVSRISQASHVLVQSGLSKPVCLVPILCFCPYSSCQGITAYGMYVQAV